MPYDLPPKAEPIPLVQNETIKSKTPEISSESKAFIQSLEGSKIEPIGMQFFDSKDNICNLTKFKRKDGTSVYVTLEHCVRHANKVNLAGIKNMKFKTILGLSPDLKSNTDSLIYYEANEFEIWQKQAQYQVQIRSLKEYMNPSQQQILETVRFSNTCEVKDIYQDVLIQTQRRVKELRSTQLLSNSSGFEKFDSTKVKSLSMYEALSAQPGDSAGFLARVGKDTNKLACIKIEGFIQSGDFEEVTSLISEIGDVVVNRILGHSIRFNQEGEPFGKEYEEDIKILEHKLNIKNPTEQNIGQSYLKEFTETLQINGYTDKKNQLLKQFAYRVNIFNLNGNLKQVVRNKNVKIVANSGKLNIVFPDFKMSTGETIKPKL